MSDLIQAVQTKADVIRVRVITRYCEMEGNLHCPRVGRKERTLSALLNNRENGFLALTDVRVIRADGRQEGPHAFLQINLQAVEYIQPFPTLPDEVESELETD